MRIRDRKNFDPGWEEVGSGFGIRDQEKPPGSATLVKGEQWNGKGRGWLENVGCMYGGT
jgi:hypothetical protein